MTMMDISSLSNLAADAALVQIVRSRFKRHERIRGIVVGVSERLLVINKLSDTITLDGFEVLRIRDLGSVTADFPKKDFYARALRLKEIRPQPLPPIDITDIPAAVGSISKSFPLLVLSRERVDPEVVWIGRVTDMRKTGFHAQLIDPCAELEDVQEFYRFDSITRIEFGGGYETTLALVAGLT